MRVLTNGLGARAASPRLRLALAAGTVGVGVVALSAVVPWITVFRGLQPLPGFILEGGPLAGMAVAALALLGVAGTRGGGRWIKPLTALTALAVLGDAVLLQIRIGDYVSNPGPAASLVQPVAGVGAALLAAGAALILVAVVVLPVRTTHLQPRTVAQLVAAGALFVAGWIHLLLVPDHLAEATVLGLGFLAAGLAQLILAALVMWWPRHAALATIVALNATLIAIYSYAVVVGLPFGEGTEHAAAAAGLVIGRGEPIDAVGAITKVAEVLSVGIAFLLLGQPAEGLGPRRAAAASGS